MICRCLIGLLLPLQLMGHVLCISGGQCVGDGELSTRDVWIEDGRIVSPQPAADEVVDASGLIVGPGLIDLQLNGAFGVDFNREPHRVGEVAAQLPRSGVTSFLPTLISTTPVLYREAIPHLQPCSMVGCAHILGAHLEGPFLARQKRGCHDGGVMRNAPGQPGAELERCYGSLKGVRMVTLAPERGGVSALVECLVQQGIVVGAGHTMARELPQGVEFVTHLFNGMRSFHHRDPALVGATLTCDDLRYSLICDGIHVHPTAVKLAWRAHPMGMVLVTDAMAAMGMEAGRYHIGSREVVVSAALGARLAGSDILAGSVLMLDQAVQNLWQITGCPPARAIEAASTRPAEVLGLSRTKGTLEVGSDADIVLFDEELKLRATFVMGQRVWP